MRLYFDNAATTPLDDQVLQAMLPYLKGHYGNPSSIHADGRQSRMAIERARRHIAQCLGASIGEIFFTSGGTEANNMALYCAVRDLGVERIISSPTEHHCILHTLDALAKYQGVEVRYLQVDGQGHISESELLRLLESPDKKTMVSLMFANNEIGTLHDFERLSGICGEHGALFHSDTVQAMGLYPFDLSKARVDFMSGSAHKFYGPKGVGFIYINGDNTVKPYLHGGSQERNMRGGTENLPGIVGMAAALQAAHNDMDHRKAHIAGLREYMKTQLQARIPDLVVNGSETAFLPKVLSVSIPPTEKGDMLLMLLDIGGVSASGGSACSSGVESESHVLRAVQGDSDYKTIRFSFSYHNTAEQVDEVVSKLMGILEG